MKRRILAAVVPVLLAGCATAGNDFSLTTVESLNAGMSQSEVIALLGQPTGRTRLADGSSQLIWSHAKANAFGSARSKAVVLRFDTDGKYTGEMSSNQTDVR